MKEETKNRLKKFGKVTAYVLGLFAMLLLGVGLGNCSARDKSVKANAETGQSLADQKTLSPKRALDPDEWYNLNDNPDNLLLGGYAGAFALSRQDYGDVAGYRVNDSVNYFLYLVHLDAGAYAFDHDSSVDTWIGSYLFVDDNGANELIKRYRGEPVDRAFLEDADIQDGVHSIQFGISAPRTILSVSSSFSWFVANVSSSRNVSISLAVYDPLKAPAVASFDFPVLFNPYPLGGSPASGDFIFNGPAVSEGTIVQTQTLYFNGLSFRSNGKLYNRIILSYKHDSNQTFGHYDASGNFVLDGTLGAKAWFFDYMIYSYGSQYSDVVWNAKFENVDSNLAWKPALVSGGLWVAQEYRHIEILSFSGSTLSGLPSSSLVLDSSVESVLKLLASYVAPSTAEMGNPFTLIREGFSSVGGILQIQILPFMTLGTLIFVPLVVLVILAILKLLAK